MRQALVALSKVDALKRGVSLLRAAAAADTEFFEDNFQGAKVGEGGLQQVKADEGREPQPVATVIMSQQEAGQDEDTREPADDKVHSHSNRFIRSGIPSRVCKKGYGSFRMHPLDLGLNLMWRSSALNERMADSVR